MSITKTSSEQPLKVIFAANTNTMHSSPSWIEVDDGWALAQQVARLTELLHEHDLTEAHLYFTEFQWGPETCTENFSIDTERLVVGHGGFGLQAAIDDCGGKFESDTIDSTSFVAAVEACTEAILYFPPNEAEGLKAEIEAYQAEEESATESEMVDGDDPRFYQAGAIEFGRQFTSAQLTAEALKGHVLEGELAGKRLKIAVYGMTSNVKYGRCEPLFAVHHPDGSLMSHYFARALTAIA